jgi:hypothetical protein
MVRRLKPDLNFRVVSPTVGGAGEILVPVGAGSHLL